VDRQAVFEQLEAGHLAGRCDAFVACRGDDELRLFKNGQRHRRAVQVERGAHAHLGHAALAQRFTVDYKPRRKRIDFALVVETGEVRKRAVRQHDQLLARLGAEWQRDPVLFVRLVFVARHPDGGVLHFGAVLVEHGKDLAGGAGAHEVGQSALADDRAAALAVADDLDDIDAAVVDAGELERALDLAIGRLVARIHLLFVGYEPVEVDVGIDLALVLAVIGAGVHFENLHDQCAHVLGPHRHLGRVAHAVAFPVGGVELDSHALFELLEVAGRQPSRPFFKIANTVQDLRLGKHPLQVVLIEEFDIRLVRLLRNEEVLEIVAHEPLVIRDGGQSTVGLAEIGHEIPVFGLFHEVAADISHVAGELDIGHETVLVARALSAVKDETLV